MIRLLKVDLTAELSVFWYINIYLKKRKKSPVQFCEIVHRKKCHSTIIVTKLAEKMPQNNRSHLYSASVRYYIHMYSKVSRSTWQKKSLLITQKENIQKSLFPGNVDSVDPNVSNSVDPNDDFISFSAAQKLPLDTLLLPNNHRYDCTSVSLISRPETIVALDTSLHQLPVTGPVTILSLFAPNMRPRNYLLTLYCITNASSHQNF